MGCHDNAAQGFCRLALATTEHMRDMLVDLAAHAANINMDGVPMAAVDAAAGLDASAAHLRVGSVKEAELDAFFEGIKEAGKHVNKALGVIKEESLTSDDERLAAIIPVLTLGSLIIHAGESITRFANDAQNAWHLTTVERIKEANRVAKAKQHFEEGLRNLVKGLDAGGSSFGVVELGGTDEDDD